MSFTLSCLLLEDAQQVLAVAGVAHGLRDPLDVRGVM